MSSTESASTTTSSETPSIVSGPPSLTHPETSSNNNTSSPESNEETPTSQSNKAKKKSKGRIFQCSGYHNCSMSFTRSEHLARHIRKHTGERPFKCEHCSRRFSRLDNLRQHKQTVHIYENFILTYPGENVNVKVKCNSDEDDELKRMDAVGKAINQKERYERYIDPVQQQQRQQHQQQPSQQAQIQHNHPQHHHLSLQPPVVTPIGPNHQQTLSPPHSVSPPTVVVQQQSTMLPPPRISMASSMHNEFRPHLSNKPRALFVQNSNFTEGSHSGSELSTPLNSANLLSPTSVPSPPPSASQQRHLQQLQPHYQHHPHQQLITPTTGMSMNSPAAFSPLASTYLNSPAYPPHHLHPGPQPQQQIPHLQQQQQQHHIPQPQYSPYDNQYPSNVHSTIASSSLQSPHNLSFLISNTTDNTTGSPSSSMKLGYNSPPLSQTKTATRSWLSSVLNENRTEGTTTNGINTTMVPTPTKSSTGAQNIATISSVKTETPTSRLGPGNSGGVKLPALNELGI